MQDLASEFFFENFPGGDTRGPSQRTQQKPGLWPPSTFQPWLRPCPPWCIKCYNHC